jgi:hypothetical protein
MTTLRTRVRFAVYRDEPVAGWPASYRRLVRDGTVPARDVGIQAVAAGEVVFVVNGFDPIMLDRDCVELTADGPAIVQKPN